MRIVQTSYPRVKKIYTYDITQEELDKLEAKRIQETDESPKKKPDPKPKVSSTKKPPQAKKQTPKK